MSTQWSSWMPLGDTLSSVSQLCVLRTLLSGQAFGWRKCGRNRVVGVLGYHLVQIEQLPQPCFRVFGPNQQTEARKALFHYFRGEHDLDALYLEWSTLDSRLKEAASRHPGLRLLRQNPVECLFSFICSANNSIKRNTGMLASLRRHFGAFVGEIGNGDRFHAFPTLEELSKATETQLRDLGFGYRAAYIVESARILSEERPKDFLSTLCNQSSAEIRLELVKLPGIGPKVADCIALFSLEQLDIVPIDTHVWQIANRWYSRHLPAIKSKTLTAATYKCISEMFQKIYGPLAGWAHCLLFVDELNESFDISTEEGKPVKLESAVPSQGEAETETDEQEDYKPVNLAKMMLEEGRVETIVAKGEFEEEEHVGLINNSSSSNLKSVKLRRSHRNTGKPTRYSPVH